MLTQARHLVHQRGMIAALGASAADALRHRLKQSPVSDSALPGPEVRVHLPPPSDSLIDDFLRHVASDVSAHRGTVPPALFPQWGLPVALRALRGSGFPVVKILNGGCRLEVKAPLHRGRALTVRARLASVTGDDRRSVLCQRIITEQDGVEALVADVYGIIRAPDKDKSRQTAKQPEPLPGSAQKLEEWNLPRDSGLTFALLTGDVNPLHWLAPYARAMGFRGTILHGFSALAHAYAGLTRAFSPRHLRLLDVRFARPILLPARVALYVAEGQVFVGAAGDAPHLTGTFECA